MENFWKFSACQKSLVHLINLLMHFRNFLWVFGNSGLITKIFKAFETLLKHLKNFLVHFLETFGASQKLNDAFKEIRCILKTLNAFSEISDAFDPILKILVQNLLKHFWVLQHIFGNFQLFVKIFGPSKSFQMHFRIFSAFCKLYYVLQKFSVFFW